MSITDYGQQGIKEFCMLKNVEKKEAIAPESKKSPLDLECSLEQVGMFRLIRKTTKFVA